MTLTQELEYKIEVLLGDIIAQEFPSLLDDQLVEACEDDKYRDWAKHKLIQILEGGEL
jgi:hypothetical protein